MSPLLPLLGLAGVGLFFLNKAKASPGGVSSSAATNTVPVMLGDNKTVSANQKAEWHPTADQNALFGPRRPDFWNLNGYYMFKSLTKPAYDMYKPDWQVKLFGSAL